MKLGNIHEIGVKEMRDRIGEEKIFEEIKIEKLSRSSKHTKQDKHKENHMQVYHIQQLKIKDKEKILKQNRSLQTRWSLTAHDPQEALVCRWGCDSEFGVAFNSVGNRSTKQKLLEKLKEAKAFKNILNGYHFLSWDVLKYHSMRESWWQCGYKTKERWQQQAMLHLCSLLSISTATSCLHRSHPRILRAAGMMFFSNFFPHGDSPCTFLRTVVNYFSVLKISVILFSTASLTYKMAVLKLLILNVLSYFQNYFHGKIKIYSLNLKKKKKEIEAKDTLHMWWESDKNSSWLGKEILVRRQMSDITKVLKGSQPESYM